MGNKQIVNKETTYPNCIAQTAQPFLMQGFRNF